MEDCGFTPLAPGTTTTHFVRSNGGRKNLTKSVLMSSGHRHHPSGGFGIDTNHLDRVLKMGVVQEALNRPFTISKDYDLPYIAGYSNDSSKIYIDRHTPEILKLYQDGKYKEFDPTPFLTAHEHTEKSLIDALRYDYDQAHKVATAAERRLFVASIGPGWWPLYQQKMDTFAKHDEYEKLKKIPSDLDMTPYFAPPVDRRLVAHLEKFVTDKMSKEEAEYSNDRGRPNHHCGPSKEWPKGYCSMYREENRCTLVRGYIAHQGGCKYWEKAK
jgi:hypothetical protein